MDVLLSVVSDRQMSDDVRCCFVVLFSVVVLFLFLRFFVSRCDLDDDTSAFIIVGAPSHPERLCSLLFFKNLFIFSASTNHHPH